MSAGTRPWPAPCQTPASSPRGRAPHGRRRDQHRVQWLALRSRAPAEAARALESIAERLPLHERHRVPGNATRFARGKEGNHVRVLKTSGDGNLALESFDRPRRQRRRRRAVSRPRGGGGRSLRRRRRATSRRRQVRARSCRRHRGWLAAFPADQRTRHLNIRPCNGDPRVSSRVVSPVASTLALPPAARRIISPGPKVHNDAILSAEPPDRARQGTGGVSSALRGVVPSEGRGSAHRAAIAQIRIMTSFWS